MERVTIASREAKLPTGEVIAYCEQGEKRDRDEPVMLLLHGYCGSSSYWKEVLPHLSKHGRVIVPDLRGHGASTAPKQDVYDMNDYADDVAMLMDALGESQAILIGHSLGGYVTLAAAERYPDKLRAYGLVHSTALPDGEEAKANRDKAAAAIREQGIAAFVEGLVPKLFAPGHVATMADQVEQAKAIGRGTAPEAAIATAMGMKQRPDRSRVLREAVLPVLLVAGQEDGVVPPERTLSGEAGPAASRVLLEGCGHMSMLERPERLAAELAAFASSVKG